MTKEELENTLIEVRKAYRLIYLYQRRTLDLIEYIGNRLGFTFERGHSKFSTPAGSGTNVKLKNWSWDWLQLYLYHFKFTTASEKIFFSIVLASDTGYFESNSVDKLDISNFVDSENSGSCLYFIITKGEFKCPVQDLLVEKKLFTPEKSLISISDSNILWLVKGFNISDFLNQSETKTRIQFFIESVKKENIQIYNDLNFDKVDLEGS